MISCGAGALAREGPHISIASGNKGSEPARFAWEFAPGLGEGQGSCEAGRLARAWRGKPRSHTKFKSPEVMSGLFVSASSSL
jgi:hypothetical protein